MAAVLVGGGDVTDLLEDKSVLAAFHRDPQVKRVQKVSKAGRTDGFAQRIELEREERIARLNDVSRGRPLVEIPDDTLRQPQFEPGIGFNPSPGLQVVLPGARPTVERM